MLDARYWMLAKKGEIPYRYPVSRNQNPVSLPNESQTSLYGDEAVKPKNIILRAIAIITVIAPPPTAYLICAGAQRCFEFL